MPHVDVYDLFIEEMKQITIRSDDTVVHVVGEMTRAVKRAQNKYDNGYGCGHNGHMNIEGIRYGMIHSEEDNYSMEICDG